MDEQPRFSSGFVIMVKQDNGIGDTNQQNLRNKCRLSLPQRGIKGVAEFESACLIPFAGSICPACALRRIH